MYAYARHGMSASPTWGRINHSGPGGVGVKMVLVATCMISEESYLVTETPAVGDAVDVVDVSRLSLALEQALALPEALALARVQSKERTSELRSILTSLSNIET